MTNYGYHEVTLDVADDDLRGTAVVYFDNGAIRDIDDSHPNFQKVAQALLSGADVDEALFEPVRQVFSALRRLSDRITLRDGVLFFDGDAVENTLTDAIVSAVQNGEGFAPLVLFMEKIAENPNRHSRVMAYDWLTAQAAEGGFTIDAEGYLLGYKGVQNAGNGVYKSISSGTAWVNDVEKRGQIPQSVGDTVSMARSQVEHDPSVGCHVGLHVGTWSYASSWGHGVVLKVRIHPRDIVSVPTDCSYQKMRVSRYEVVDVIDAPMNTLVDEYDEDDWDEPTDEADPDDLWWNPYI